MVFHSEKIFWELLLLTYLTRFVTIEYKLKTFQYNTYVTGLISRKFCNLFIIFSKPCYFSWVRAFLPPGVINAISLLGSVSAFVLCFISGATRGKLSHFLIYTGDVFNLYSLNLGNLPANPASACDLTHSITRS